MLYMKDGSLLLATEDIIGHQVNCMGKFNAGLAKEIRNAYPEAYYDYMKTCHMFKDRRELLGKVKITNIAEKRIAHLFGQYHYGRDRRYTDYPALTTCLIKLRTYASSRGLTIALPEGVGCNLAGGDWDKVRGIIDQVFAEYEVTIYKYGGNDE